MSGRSLGGCGGLKCGEFQKGFEMGSAGFQEVGGEMLESLSVWDGG